MSHGSYKVDYIVKYIALKDILNCLTYSALIINFFNFVFITNFKHSFSTRLWIASMRKANKLTIQRHQRHVCSWWRQQENCQINGIDSLHLEIYYDGRSLGNLRLKDEFVLLGNHRVWVQAYQALHTKNLQRD